MFPRRDISTPARVLCVSSLIRDVIVNVIVCADSEFWWSAGRRNRRRSSAGGRKTRRRGRWLWTMEVELPRWEEAESGDPNKVKQDEHGARAQEEEE